MGLQPDSTLGATLADAIQGTFSRDRYRPGHPGYEEARRVWNGVIRLPPRDGTRSRGRRGDELLSAGAASSDTAPHEVRGRRGNQNQTDDDLLLVVADALEVEAVAENRDEERSDSGSHDRPAPTEDAGAPDD